MTRFFRGGVAWIGLVACLGASAADQAPPPPVRDAYRYTDEKGRVGYSEYAPPSGNASKKIDITPANSGNPGPSTRSKSDKQTRSSAARKDGTAEKQTADNKQPANTRTDEAKQKEQAALCARYGGEGCPDTLTRSPENSVQWRTKPPPEPVPYPGPSRR